MDYVPLLEDRIVWKERKEGKRDCCCCSVEREAKSIVAGPSFVQYLNKLFKIQIAAGDVLQFESGNHDKFFMFSLTGTWDEIIKLQ